MAVISLSLDAGEQGVVGNMVVVNTEDRAITLTVTGDGPVLRGKQIIEDKDADTPALKVYCMVTDIYINPGNLQKHREAFTERSNNLIAEIPAAAATIAAISESLIVGDFRGAYEKSFDLLRFEEEIEEGDDGGQPDGAGAQ